jgi:hypothetical protein
MNYYSNKIGTNQKYGFFPHTGEAPNKTTFKKCLMLVCFKILTGFDKLIQKQFNLKVAKRLNFINKQA